MPSKSQAKSRISKALEAIPDLRDLNTESPEFIKWRRDTEVAISYTFGEDSRHTKDFGRINFSSISSLFDHQNSSEEARAYRSGLDEARAVLESMLGEIEEYWPDDRPLQSYAEIQTNSEKQVSNRVFRGPREG